MDQDVFRSAPGADFEQGDVLELCPAGSIGALRVVREWAPPRDKPDQNPLTGFIYTEPISSDLQGREKPSPALWSKKPTELMLFDGTRRRCMVLSDTCIVIEKAQNQAKAIAGQKAAPPWPIHVAPIRDWPSRGEMVKVGDTEVPQSDLLEQDKVHRYLPLPAYRAPDGREVLPQSYVDLRYATPVKLDILMACKKVASLNGHGTAILQRKMFTFFSGIRIPKAVACPSCSTPHAADEFLVREIEE